MIDKNKKIIVLMPPKTASNSIKQTLEKQGVKFSSPTKKTNSPLIHLKLNEIVDLFEIDNLNEYKIFQIVRNPYNRFVSSYFHQVRILNNMKTVKFINYNLNQFSKHLHNTIKSENFLKNFYGDTSFIERSIKNGVSWGGSRLYDTQLSWKNLDCNITYFKLEDVSVNIQPISDFLEISLPKLDIVNFHSNGKNYSELIDDEIKLIVEKIFAEDIKVFQYLNI
jgi:hypothetical protein